VQGEKKENDDEGGGMRRMRATPVTASLRSCLNKKHARNAAEALRARWNHCYILSFDARVARRTLRTLSQEI